MWNYSLERNFSTCLSQLGNAIFDAIKICLVGIAIVMILIQLLFYLCNTVRFITFTTNLSTMTKTKKNSISIFPHVIFISYITLFLEYEEFRYISINNINFNFCYKTPRDWKARNYFKKVCFILLNVYIFNISNTIQGDLLCLMTFQNASYFFNRHTQWLHTILIILANDVHQNPGPYHNSYFTFMNWNCNSLAKDDFQRLRLLEAQNSVFNYDLISLCETSLNDQIKMPDQEKFLNNEYSYIASNKPDSTRHGGVGLLYRNSLPLRERKDLSFPESIVVELNFGRKKIFFTVLYRSPSFNYSTVEFANFLSNFKELYQKIKLENPYMTFFTGDFNGQSQLWYPGGVTTPEGSDIENLISSLGLYQIIREPTNFVPNKNPTCIDLIITDQPNLILNCATRPSPHSVCHHQIIHCKVNFNLPPPTSTL